MEIWIDAQLSPSLAFWLGGVVGGSSKALRQIGLRDADDTEIFFRAKDQQAVILTKDADFVLLLQRHGPPPRIIWLTCGNTTNQYLRSLLVAKADVLKNWLKTEDPLIEIGSS